MELQPKDVIGRTVGIQSASHLPASDESMFASQHDEGPVDEFHQELLGLTCKTNTRISLDMTDSQDCPKIISDHSYFKRHHD